MPSIIGKLHGYILKYLDMEKIYSQVEPGLLLHIVVRFRDFTQTRQDIIDPDNFLQCAIRRMNEGQTFRPHKHIEVDITYKTKRTQEAWIIIKGIIQCVFYDIDDTVIAKPCLNAGDMCITLQGGHMFIVLCDDTCMIEMKTGIYEGQARDKVFINT
jgi:hypothetical protein